MADFDAEGMGSGDDTNGSPRVHLAKRKRGLAPDNDSEPESEASFKHGGRKRRGTVIPRDAKINLRDFFLMTSRAAQASQPILRMYAPFPHLLLSFSFTLLFWF